MDNELPIVVNKKVPLFAVRKSTRAIKIKQFGAFLTDTPIRTSQKTVLITSATHFKQTQMKKATRKYDTLRPSARKSASITPQNKNLGHHQTNLDVDSSRKRSSVTTTAVRKFPNCSKKPNLSNDYRSENYQEPCIGIDLGTSFSSVGVYRDGKVEIIANEHSNRSTPSYLGFNDSGKLFGEVAKNQMATNPFNTIFDAKRLIGRKFGDSTVQNDLKYWPFKLMAHDGGIPKVFLPGLNVSYSPGFIATMILEKIKETAEAYLEEDVTDAVITVPAHFTDSQRQLIKEAGTYSGLRVRRVMNETSAAAIAYGLENKCDDLKNVLIYDLGGGFLDVSVVSIEGTVFFIKATANESHLGGEDFDVKLIDHLAKKFERKHPGKDLSSNPRALRLLRTACEGAKRTLSHLTQATIEIVSLHQGINFYTTITRSCFEDLCADLFLSTLEPVKKALHDAKMDKSEINEIVLVGGSTRIPKIQKLLQHFFNGKELNKSINPDEAVAYGATFQAAILSGHLVSEAKDFLLLESSSHSLGVETGQGMMSTIIERNSTFPIKQTKIFTTKNDKQSSILIQVYEGEGVSTRENNLLGKFIFSEIRPANSGVPRIEITFDMDADGILTVTVKDKSIEGREQIISQKINGRSNRVMEGNISDANDMKLVLCKITSPSGIPPTQLRDVTTTSSISASF